MRTRFFRIFGATCGLILAGCASYSGIAPDAKVLSVTALKGSPAIAPYNAWPNDQWWREFSDPVLNDLIEQALADSPGLRVAAAKIKRAQAITGLAESTLWPQIGASMASTRERFSERGEIPPPFAGSTQTINDLQISARWEVDFFGKNRDELKSALGELRVAAAEGQAARILLTTELARAYYGLARLLTQREVAEQRSKQRRELAALRERRFKAGLDTRVEWESAQGLLSEHARDLAALDEQIGLIRHALSALIGQGPEAAQALSPGLPAVTPVALPQFVPAELLGHRADVVAARWRVESAVHGLESSKAQFYPNINLRAFTGFSAIGIDHWLDAGSRQPGIGLAINLPLFDSGRLRSLYRSNAALVETAAASYNATLLEALRDAADQLTTLQSLEIQLARQQAALASASRNHELFLQRYRSGINDRLAVLDSETNLIAQRRNAIDLQSRWIDSRIRLIRSLGGGFNAQMPDPAAQPDAGAPLAARKHSGILTDKPHDH